MTEKWLFVVLFGSIAVFSVFVSDHRMPDGTTVEEIQTLAEQYPSPWFSPVSVEPLVAPETSVVIQDYKQLDDAWSAAQIYLRHNDELVFGRAGDAPVRARLEDLLSGIALPTIVYMPGCTLPRWAGPSHFWRRITRSGFAVIGIDGFARSDWKQLCADELLMARAASEQIQFVLQQLKQIPWVDRNNLFLMGYGEGGSAVSAYLGEGFNGIVVVAASCRAHLLQPVAPLLAVASEHDAALDDTRNYCDYAKERLLIDSVVHGVLVYEDAQQAVYRFLQRHLI